MSLELTGEKCKKKKKGLHAVQAVSVLVLGLSLDSNTLYLFNLS